MYSRNVHVQSLTLLYTKVTIICRCIFLRFWDSMHFTGIFFGYFQKCGNNIIIIIIPVQYNLIIYTYTTVVVPACIYIIDVLYYNLYI